MKKKLLFVMEELIQGIPSGVVSVSENLLNQLKRKYDILIILNSSHWALKDNNKFKYFHSKKKKINFNTYSELNYNLKKFLPNFIVKLFIFWLKPILFFRLLIYSYIFIKKNKIQIILNHSGGWPGGEVNFAFSIVSYFLRVKNVLVIHNLSSYKKNFIRSLVNFRDRFYNITANKILTVSKVCKNDLLKNTFLKKIEVISNGCEDFSKLKKKKIKKEKKFIVGYVGHIHERKGLKTVIQALKNTKNTIKFIIIGGGDKKYIETLKNLSKENSVNTLFIKNKKKKYNFYYNFDLFILPSKKFESFGLVVIEAMSSSRAIICSDFGGMKEIIRNNKNGILFKKEDFNDLRKKIFYLKNNEHLMKKLSNQARKDYLKYYTSKTMSSNYIKKLSSLKI